MDMVGVQLTHCNLPPLSDLTNPNIDMAALGDPKATQALLRDLGIIP